MSTRRRRRRSASSATDKWKNKEWFDIRTPSYIDEKSLGNSPSSSDKHVIGRTIKTTLMELTGDFKDMNYELLFKVTNLDGKIARTDFFGQELSRDFMRAQVRNHRSKVDGIYTYKLSDESRIRISTFIVTPSRIPSSEKKELRKLVYEKLSEEVSQLNFGGFVNKLISGELRDMLLEVAEDYTDIKVLDVSKVKVLRFPVEEVAA